MTTTAPLTHVIPLGTTKAQDFELRDNGVAIDGTGLAVTLSIVRYADGVRSEVETPPTVAWLDQAGGTVRVSGVANLIVGNYRVRFVLTNGSDIEKSPNGEAEDLWRVVV